MKKVFSGFRQVFSHERRAVIILTTLVLTFLIVSWWQARKFIEGQLIRDAKSVVQDSLDSYSANLYHGVLDKIALTESLSGYLTIEVSHTGELDGQKLEEFAGWLYQSTGRIKNIAVAPDGVMQFVYPYEENKSVLGYEPAIDQRPEVQAQVQLAIETGEVTISQPVVLIQGGMGLITRQAVFVDGEYWGLANIVLDVPGLLDDAGVTSSSNIDLAIRDNNGVVFVGSESVFDRQPVYASISLPGGAWQIAGVPHAGWDQFFRGGIFIIDVMAYIIMLLAGYMTYRSALERQILSKLVDERTAALRKTESELLEDIAIRKQVEKEKDQLIASESYQRAIAETLSEITLALNSHIDIDSILQEILEQIQTLIPYETANIVLIEDGKLNVRAHRGYEKYGPQTFFEGFDIEKGEKPIDYEAALSGTPVLLFDVQKEPDWVMFEGAEWIRSFVSVPIVHKGTTFGMIRLDGKKENQFSASAIDLLNPIANAAAIALENASLFAQAQKEIEERIKAENQIRTLNDRLEERVLLRTRELEEANRELEAFSYSISHDLRAPLRAVSGISELFREEYGGILDSQGFEYLERMDASGKKMSDLIEGLLTLTQLGRQGFSTSSFNFQEMAAEIFDDLASQSPARKISFYVEGSDVVEADSRLISALLTNLLSNAIKFTRKEENAVVKVGSELREGGRVFFVEDNGVGVDVDQSEKLFEPFQRFILEAEFEGMGIGLAIAKRIVARHHGKIWVESGEERGAKFLFSLGHQDEN